MLGLAVGAVALVALAPAAGAAPTNDAFSAAEPLSSAIPATASGTNLEATKEAGEPNHAGDAGGHSVWYSWTPSSNQPVGIRCAACFGHIDTLLIAVVCTGTAVNALTPVASNEYSISADCFFSESAESNSKRPSRNDVLDRGRRPRRGTGLVRTFLRRFPGQRRLRERPGAWRHSPSERQQLQPAEQQRDRRARPRRRAQRPLGLVLLDPIEQRTGRDLDLLALGRSRRRPRRLHGASIGALTEVASNDDGTQEMPYPGCLETDGEIFVDAVAGTTYRIAVDGFRGTVGKFNLRIRGRPKTTTSRMHRSSLRNCPFTHPGSTPLPGHQADRRARPCGRPGGPLGLVLVDTHESSRVLISTCNTEGDGIDTVLAVYTGAGLESLTPVAGNDDGSHTTCRPTDSEVRFDAEAGKTYSIAVDGKSDDQARFSLDFEAPSGNDDFADAQVVNPGLPISTSGSTRFASKEAGEPNHAGDPGGDSVWYSWTPSDSGPVTISVCLYWTSAPTPCSPSTPALRSTNSNRSASNDNSPAACKEMGSAVEIQAVASTTYWIAVDGKEGSEGIFSLDLNGTPANDDFADADELPAEPMMAGGLDRFRN